MANRADRSWKIILSVLCALAVVLIAAIFIVKNLNQKPDEHGKEANLIEQAQAEVFELGATDIPAVIRVYQTYIDVADDETKVELYNKRIRYILNNDLDKEYGEQVISDQVAIDDILQTVDSAVQVVNILYYYGDYGELLDKYNYLIKHREETEGIDIDMETVG